MKSFTYLSITLFILSIASAHADGLNLNDNASLDIKFSQLTTSLYCYCGCSRETLQQCVCGVSQQTQEDFRNRLAAGATVEQIRDDYIAAHGPQYSALMPAEGFNIVAYVMPGIIIVLLGIVVFLFLKLKSRSQHAQQPAPTKPQSSASTDSYRQIEEEIERYKRQR